MAQMQGEQPIAKFIGGNPFFDLAREIRQAATTRGDGEFVEKLVQHFEIYC